MKIKFYRSRPYGRELIFIAEPATAKIIQVVSGRKTLSKKKMQALEKMGHEFEEVLPPQK